MRKRKEGWRRRGRGGRESKAGRGEESRRRKEGCRSRGEEEEKGSVKDERR